MLGNVAVLGLLLSFFSFTLVNRASAQIQTLPHWAVVEFEALGDTPKDAGYGTAAADAVTSELSNTKQYRLDTRETIDRAISTLGLTSPLQGSQNVLRVGQQLRATTIVTGKLAGVRIKPVPGGRQAFVAMQVTAYDVASGLAVNGAVVTGESTVRSGSVSDQTLINDALAQGASNSVQILQSQSLPSATVLNTLTTQAYINEGTRAGFKAGQDVIITRSREEVAAGHITDLEPDEAVVAIDRPIKGVEPGDHVRAVFPVPEIDLADPFGGNNQPRVHRNRTGNSNNSSLVTLALLAGLVGVLLGNGGASDQSVVASVTARADLYPEQSFGPGIGVRINWSPNGFAKGNTERFAWQVFRDDVPGDVPVCVVDGQTTQVWDLVTANGLDNQYTTYTDLGNVIGGTTCNDDLVDNATNPGTVPSVVAGVPYTYQVQLVYVLSELDLPISQTSGQTGGLNGNTGGLNGNTGGLTTGNTGGLTTTGGTTGGTVGGTNGGTTAGTTTGNTTGTANTTGEELCSFVSSRSSTPGPATPLNPPVLQQPAANQQVQSSQPFQWLGSARSVFLNIQYIVQFSTRGDFKANVYTYPTPVVSYSAGQTATTGNAITFGPLTLNPGSGDALPPIFDSFSTVYWRVGAAVTTDNPGPVPDFYTHKPYIFSQVSFFEKSTAAGYKAKTSMQARKPVLPSKSSGSGSPVKHH